MLDDCQKRVDICHLLSHSIFKSKVTLLSSWRSFYLLQSNNTTTMGLLDKLRRKKDETVEKVKEQTTPQPTHPTNAPPPPGKRIKRYTSEGKPVYE